MQWHKHFQYNSALLQIHIWWKKMQSCMHELLHRSWNNHTKDKGSSNLSYMFSGAWRLLFALFLNSSQLLKIHLLDCLRQLYPSGHKEAYPIREIKLRGSCWKRVRLLQWMYFIFEVSFECFGIWSKHFSLSQVIYILFFNIFIYL